MDKSARRLGIVTVLLVGAALAAAALYLSGNSDRSLEAAADAHTGFLQVKVEDGTSGEPIAGARVVIPEAGIVVVTGEDGSTELMEVPVLMQSVGETQKTWGEVSVLVYAAGYEDYALFNAHVYENRARRALRALMFASETLQEAAPFTITEAPERLWVGELLDKYR